MVISRRKLNNALSVVSIGILFAGIIFGIITKGNNLKAVSKQQPDSDSRFEQNQPVWDIKNKSKQTVCKEFLEEDENSLLLKEYGKGDVALVECLSVRCGGVF